MSQYTSLSWSAACSTGSQAARFLNPKRGSQVMAKWSDPASIVADSLLSNLPVQVHTSTILKHADAIMDGTSSRYALVLNAADDLVGVLALRDLHGRKAVKKARDLNLAHDDLSVDYLMTPIDQLPVITRAQLDSAKIGDVVATLQSSGYDFLLVQDQGKLVAIVASLNIVQRTGESVQVRHHTDSFADLLYAVKHHDDVE